MKTSQPKQLHKYIGNPVPRIEGTSKVTGRAIYTDDLKKEGLLFGKTIRSTIASGRIQDIRFEEGVDWEEFTIVTAQDLPVNKVMLIEGDQPALADGVVRHAEEPILLIAHEDPTILYKASQLISIDYEESRPVLEIGEGEVMKEYTIRHNDTETEFEKCDIIFESFYTTPAQEHVYIEPNAFLAYWSDESLVVHGSLQCPFYVHKALKQAFQLRDEEVNVIQEATGGGFGGKEDFPSMIAIHAALLSRKSGRPVKLIYDRQEDMACSTKRHPSMSRVKIGCDKNGVFKALEIDFMLDGGAYVTLSPVVLSRGILHSFGPYKWPSASLKGTCFYTNSPPYGAFRGFGAPQSLFAIELHISRLANELGIDPAEIRRRNFLKQGDQMPTGQIMKQNPPLEKLLDRALEVSDYHEKNSYYLRGCGHGMGISAFMHGTGFTGSGEVYLDSVVRLEGNQDGTLEIKVSSTEIGQGTETIFAQIAAEASGIDIHHIRFRKPETHAVPNSGPTVASRTCSIVGKLIEKAGLSIAEKLNGEKIEVYLSKNDELMVEEKFKPAEDIVWDDDSYRGSAYPAYSWSVDVAELNIDEVTGDPKLDGFWSTVDIGTVINPVLAMGQVEGGIAQAIGWALYENVVLDSGIMKNNQMTNYIIPTTADIPDIHVEFMSDPYEGGAFGAKGLGELPMDGPAPAIVSAICHATNRTFTSIPVTAESIFK